MAIAAELEKASPVMVHHSKSCREFSTISAETTCRVDSKAVPAKRGRVSPSLVGSYRKPPPVRRESAKLTLHKVSEKVSALSRREGGVLADREATAINDDKAR